MKQTAFWFLTEKKSERKNEKKGVNSLSSLLLFSSSSYSSAIAPAPPAALRALDARISAEALAAAARLRSGLSDAAALPADAATRLGDVFFETEVEVALTGLDEFLGRETRMATPAPPGAAVTSTVFSLARPGR